MTVRAQADLFRAFADVLLPGDGEFPSASSVGAHGLMTTRLRDVAGMIALDRLASGLLERDFASRPVEAVMALEAQDYALFDMARVALTYAYYEAPEVIAVIRGMGFQYNDAPQPKGYVMRPFDSTVDAPQTRRGHYVATDAVRRVDLSGLEFPKKR